MLLRFGLVGVVNTLVDLVVYTALVGLGVPFLAANLVSTSLGMTTSYLLNSGFTFKTQGRVLPFVLITGTGLWVVQPLVITVCGLAGVVLPKLAAITTGLLWNYVLYRRVVFR